MWRPPIAISARVTRPLWMSVALLLALPQGFTNAAVDDLQTAPGLRATLVAESPSGAHPIALDWSPQGHVWVAESITPQGQPSGRGQVVRLDDPDHDGVYDQRRLFLAGLPPVSSVLDWDPGVLIAAAPDLLYAEDRDTDGEADVVLRLFVGFGAASAQRQLNSLSVGLDGWVYAANGLAGGRVQRLQRLSDRQVVSSTSLVNLEESDFRFSPPTGQLQPVAGFTQFGRTRDDFGNWLGWGLDQGVVQVLLPGHYTDRNPTVLFPDPMEPLGRLNVDPSWSTLAAAPAWGPSVDATIFRAPSLGPVRHGNLLIARNDLQRVACVPLERTGLSFECQPGEFLTILASTSDAFAPAQIRTGPDDTLWVVDAGAGSEESDPVQGRILRLESTGPGSPAVRRWSSLLARDPLQALLSPNGTLRDLAARRVRVNPPADRIAALRTIASEGLPASSPGHIEATRTAVRVQALSTLGQLGALSIETLEQALRSESAPVRIHALQLSEPALRDSLLSQAVTALVNDPDPLVRYQLALSLGESLDPGTPEVLAQLLVRDVNDRWMRAAVLSSAAAQPLRLLEAWLDVWAARDLTPQAKALTRGLVATASARHQPEALAPRIARSKTDAALCSAGYVMDLALQSGVRADSADPIWIDILRPLTSAAREEIRTGSTTEAGVILRLPLLGAERAHREADWKLLLHHVNRGVGTAVRETALQVLLRSEQPELAALLLDTWPTLRPSVRPAILAACIERPDWTPGLLRALEFRRVVATELSPANRDRLRFHSNQRLQLRARALLDELLPEPRTTPLLGAESLLGRSGKPLPGRQVFQDRCAVCHDPPAPLRAIGPDLATIGSRTPTELLHAVLDPNAMIEPAYRTYFIETTEDESVTGVLREETDSAIRLLQVGGTLAEVPLAAALEIRASNLSLMPEGLESGLTRDGLADLIAYLESLR